MVSLFLRGMCIGGIANVVTHGWRIIVFIVLFAIAFQITDEKAARST